MEKLKITLFEYGILAFTAIVVIIGIVSAQINIQWFEEVYVVEDGFVENLTLLPLIGVAIIGICYLRKLSRYRSRWFRIVILMSILFSVFVVGEEISWGQRIFGIRSSEFFIENNSQGETNLHNLVVGSTKINKVIFSQLLTVCMAFYLIALPILYKKNRKWQAFIDYMGVPVPRVYQIMASIVLFMSILLIPSGKNAEILEVGITYIFFLIYTFPLNKHNFQTQPATK